jgi:hypothetical protein
MEDQVISEAYIDALLTPSRLNDDYGFLVSLDSDRGRVQSHGFGGQLLNIELDSGIVIGIMCTPSVEEYDYETLLEYVTDRMTTRTYERN